MTTNIKICPFCGIEPDMITVADGISHAALHMIKCNNDQCSVNPAIFNWSSTVKRATELWNKRYDDTTLGICDRDFDGNVDIYESEKDEWRWRITASNGEIVAASSESFKRTTIAIRNMQLTFLALKPFFINGK